jgi:Cytochrome c554 and c-prime
MRLLRFCLLLHAVFPASSAWGQKSATLPVETHTAPACAACHEQTKWQPATSMGHALETARECKILSAHPLLTFKYGSYSYRIERKGDESLYSVSDGAGTLTIPIRWAMGASSAIGQTYILEKDGQFYESRVSYFSGLDALDFTLGSQNSEPTDLLDAAGRRMSHKDDVECFGCHATNATQGGELTLDRMTPGVQCERCHGPAEKHMAAVSQVKPELNAMQHLASLSTEQVSSFCGQCHRTWDQIVMAGKFGITDIRFQPYRLTESKCYDADDARISCLACHDPHREVDAKSSNYDARCQSCHGGGKPGAKSCWVSTKDCASCHMPKLELPGAHHKFTDHQIRIVRANQPFPG